MKLLRTLVSALAVVVVAGTVASASPLLRAAFEVEPTPEVTVSQEPAPGPTGPPETEPTDPPETEPTEAPTPPADTSETSPPGSDDADEDASVAPDFSACEGLTGLDNAVCRHEALLAVQPENVQPENRGLQTSLDRLLANQARHAEDATETDPDEGTPDACPGKSCETHGNGHANGHANH